MKKLIVFILLVLSFNTFSYTECRDKTKSIYIGDDGALWITFVKGGAAYIKDSDTDFERTYSLFLAAQMADKDIKVRFKASNVKCNSSTRSDIRGVWLLK